MNENYKKFNEAEMLTYAFMFLGVDFIAGWIDATVIGMLIAPVLQILITWVIEELLKSKGGNVGPFNIKRFGKYFSNVLPFVPTNFLIFLFSAFRHNHPKLAPLAGAKVVGTAMNK